MYSMASTTSNFEKHTSTNPIQQYLINNFYNELLRMVKPLKAKTILDVGCGEGITLQKLIQNKIGEKLEGIDNFETALLIGRKKYPSIKFKKGDIYNLPYDDNSFDALICTEVLEHLDHPEKAIQELKRVSKKYIILSVPNEPFFIMANFIRGKYLRRFGNHPEHINHWTTFSFKKFLKSNGLRIRKERYPFAWTLILGEKSK